MWKSNISNLFFDPIPLKYSTQIKTRFKDKINILLNNKLNIFVGVGAFRDDKFPHKLSKEFIMFKFESR